MLECDRNPFYCLALRYIRKKFEGLIHLFYTRARMNVIHNGRREKEKNIGAQNRRPWYYHVTSHEHAIRNTNYMHRKSVQVPITTRSFLSTYTFRVAKGVPGLFFFFYIYRVCRSFLYTDMYLCDHAPTAI